MKNKFQKIIGKTIKSVDAKCANVMTIHFNDNTYIELEVEYMGHGIYGIQETLESKITDLNKR